MSQDPKIARLKIEGNPDNIIVQARLLQTVIDGDIEGRFKVLDTSIKGGRDSGSATLRFNAETAPTLEQATNIVRHFASKAGRLKGFEYSYATPGGSDQPIELEVVEPGA